ncbi:phospholipase A [Collimonas sp. OK242]|uniref:phospholipase A n=1 Tax=Collimonas sp. OK242 TaxID=1798195 RepID=UPI0035139891
MHQSDGQSSNLSRSWNRIYTELGALPWLAPVLQERRKLKALFHLPPSASRMQSPYA